jgi:hypothetical protein
VKDNHTRWHKTPQQYIEKVFAETPERYRNEVLLRSYFGKRTLTMFAFLNQHNGPFTTADVNSYRTLIGQRPLRDVAGYVSLLRKHGYVIRATDSGYVVEKSPNLADLNWAARAHRFAATQRGHEFIAQLCDPTTTPSDTPDDTPNIEPYVSPYAAPEDAFASVLLTQSVPFDWRTVAVVSLVIFASLVCGYVIGGGLG